jgi:hypothetical protein
MGTALTGLEIKDTYDGLVKITDNGPLSGTAKFLSDGLGNDSVLALSTTAVGIGLNTPSIKLEVQSTDVTVSRFVSTNAANTGEIAITSAGGVGNNTRGRIVGGFDAGGSGFGGFLAFNTTTTQNVNNERMRILEGGNVGIGTSTPTSGGVSSGLRIKQLSDGAFGFTGVGIESAAATAELLYFGNTGTRAVIGQTYLSAGAYQPIAFDVSGAERFRVTAYGVTFNGDTAVANALNDYEEGTFSPTIAGTTTAGTATYSEQQGRYTKIGRLVQFEIFMVYSAGTGTGNLTITNLPFTIGGSSYPSFTIGAFDNITMTALNMPMAWGNISTAIIRFAEMPVGGGAQASLAYDAAGAIQISGTYSV